jgi:hypothetical protein
MFVIIPGERFEAPNIQNVGEPNGMAADNKR